MNYLLDTNIVVFLMKAHEPLVTRLRDVSPSALAVSSITLAEMWYGAARSARPTRSRSEQDAALAPFRVLDFDANAADIYASVRARLADAGTPIGDRDLMIASIAIANRMAVITNNVSEFSRVPGLVVRDWTQAGPKDDGDEA